MAIVNNGAEEEKGNALVKETFPLLKECKGINFIGSIEARDIPYGYADVVVCEAFVGNVILKLYEGVGGCTDPEGEGRTDDQSEDKNRSSSDQACTEIHFEIL